MLRRALLSVAFALALTGAAVAQEAPAPATPPPPAPRVTFETTMGAITIEMVPMSCWSVGCMMTIFSPSAPFDCAKSFSQGRCSAASFPQRQLWLRSHIKSRSVRLVARVLRTCTLIRRVQHVRSKNFRRVGCEAISC